MKTYFFLVKKQFKKHTVSLLVLNLVKWSRFNHSFKYYPIGRQKADDIEIQQRLNILGDGPLNQI